MRVIRLRHLHTIVRRMAIDGRQHPRRLRLTWWRRRGEPNPFETNFDAVVTIHLVRATRRLDRLRRTTRRAGLERYELMDAVDGQHLKLEPLRAAKELLPLPDGDWLSLGEVGCLLSHRNAWRQMLDRGYHTMLICEDDISFDRDAANRLARAMHDVPSSWDIIHFHSWHQKRRERLTGSVFRGNSENGGTVCYAISERAARFLLAASWPMQYPADTYTGLVTAPASDGGHIAGLTGYVVWPFLCWTVGKGYINDRPPEMRRGVARSRLAAEVDSPPPS